MSRSKSRNRAGTQIVVDRVVELKGRNSLFSTIYQQQNLQSSFATKFAQKYSLVIDGPREISKDGEILIAKITKDGVMQSFGEFLDGANFSWKIGNDEEPKTGNSIIVYADDIKESPMLITCTWKYNYTSASNQTGIMGSGTAGLTTTIQVTWAEIVQYVWTNETDASKVALIPDGAWKDEYGNEPGGDYEYYLWRRVSKDNGETWSYFRESGLNGVGLKSITREFAKNTSSTTAPTEGWGTTYPERDSDEFIWIRDKITLTDNSVTYTTPYLATASNGWSNVRLTLYRRSEMEPAPFDGGVLQYTYATNTITGDLGSWSKDPPNGTDPVWAIYATAFSNDEADTISPSEWTVPARLSVEGTQGAKGESVVTLFLFQQSDTRPAVPTGNVTYNIKTHAVTGAGAWSKEVPEGSAKVWVTMATAYTSTDSVTILPSAWASPEIFREKGDSGEDAKLLDVTSDLQAFRFDKDGNPYPNQVATITVRKQGIVADTEFSASNGMKIADNSTEIKLTPYSAGMAKLTLKNIVPTDKQAYTITRTQSDTWLFCSVNIPSVANKKLYQRLTYWGDREFTQTESYTGLSLVPRPDRSKGKAYSTEKTVISDIFMADTESTNDYIFGYYLYDVTLESPLILNYEEGLLIDIGELEQAFPYFASLSDNEKKEILDTLPFFEDEFELCQTLENRSNPDKGIGTTRYYDKPDSIDYDSDTFTITFNYNNDPSITNPQYVFLGQDNLTHYPEDSGVVFYDRCEIDFTSSSAVSETTQLNRIFGNEVWTHLSGNTPSEINVPIKQYENGFHKRSFLGFTSSTNGTPVFSYLKANQLPELDGSSLRLKNIVLINLTMLGWYVYFKFIGASDNEIYQWCENLPVFKDTYQPSIDTFQLTAVAGDYSDSVILSKVQDGADGTKGEDAKLLLLTSDVSSFSLLPNGSATPDGATVTVNKQGITEDTEFIASNGMVIPDNSTEIKVTPYMLGAKFVVKNLVPSNAIYAHNTRKGPNTTVTYIDTLQYDVLNFYENGYRGRKIYIRCTYWANRNKEEGEVIGTFSFSPGNLIPVFDAPEISTTKNTVSKVYTIPIEPQIVTNRIGYYIGSTTYTTTSILKDIETYRDQTMLIDVNELEEAFPYFATLSDSEKKEILDTLPFFEDEFVLGDTLENIATSYSEYYVQGYSDTELVTTVEEGKLKKVTVNLNNSIDNSRSKLFRLIKNVNIELGDVNYSRIVGKLSKLSTYLGYGVIVGPSNCKNIISGYNEMFGLQHLDTTDTTYSVLLETTNNDHNICISYIWNPTPGSVPDLTIEFKEPLSINLTKTGWYTYFKLIGATDQAIKDWCDSLPFFEDTYDVPPQALTITATAGEHTASISIGVITNSNFEIQASPMTYAMTSRQYVKQSQVIALSCIKTNYTGSSKAVWTIPSISHISFSSADGSTVYDGTSRTGDTVYVLIEEGCVATSFKATCALEGLGTKELTVAGSYPEFKSEYLGTVDATLGQTFPTSTANGPIMVGDMVVYITEDAQGNKTSNYYICTSVNNGVGTWVPYIADTHHNSELMISGIYDAIMSGSKNSSMLSMVKQLVAQYIAAEYIRISGAIYGGSYNSDGSVEIDSSTGKQGKGFYLDKNGIAKMNDSEINGSFTASDDDGIIMQTQKKTESEIYTEATIERFVGIQYSAYDNYSSPDVSIYGVNYNSYRFRKNSTTDYDINFPLYFEGGIVTESLKLHSNSINTYRDSLCGKPIIAHSQTGGNGGSYKKTITVTGDLSNVEAYAYVQNVTDPTSNSATMGCFVKVNNVSKIDTGTIKLGSDNYGNKVAFLTKLDGLKNGDKIDISIANSVDYNYAYVGIFYTPKYRLPYCLSLYPEKASTYSNLVEYLLWPTSKIFEDKIEEFSSFTPVFKALSTSSYVRKDNTVYVKLTDSQLHVYNTSGTDLGSVTSPTQSMCDINIVLANIYDDLAGLEAGEYNTDESDSFFKMSKSWQFTSVSRISVSDLTDGGKTITVYGKTSSSNTEKSNSITVRNNACSGPNAVSMTALFKLSIIDKPRGLYVNALQPYKKNENTIANIGTTGNEFDNAYVKTLHGSVNTEETRTTYKVWGAVAN